MHTIGYPKAGDDKMSSILHKKEKIQVRIDSGQLNKTTVLEEKNLTWNERRLFHLLVNDGMDEWNAYSACLSVT